MPPKSKTVAAKRAAVASVIKDRAELESKLGQIARASILVNSITAEMNAEIEAIKARFAPRIEAARETINEGTTAVENYVLTHRGEIFARGSKTATVAGHEVSLRDNGGAIVQARGVTQAAVIDRLLTHEDEATADQFLSWKCSLNKEAAKNRWEEHQTFLESLGLRLEHTELFSIKLALVDGADTNLKTA
jgi:phage host-nuclease inhibitor protein Gam